MDDNRKEKLWEPFDGDALFIEFKSGGKLVWHRVLPGCFRSWKGRRKIVKHTTAHMIPVVSTIEEEYFGPVFYRDTNFYYDGIDTYGMAERSDKPRRVTVPRPHEDAAWMNGPSMLDKDSIVEDNFSGLKETNDQDWNSSISMNDLRQDITAEDKLSSSERSELDSAINKQKQFLNGEYK